MLQLHQALDLLDNKLFQIGLVVQEHPMLAYRLRVLATVKEPQIILAANTGGGDIGALCTGCAQPDRTTLASP